MAQDGVMPEIQKQWIPEITDERLNELAVRIRPVYDFGRRGRRYVKPRTDEDVRRKYGDHCSYLHGIAYAWDPKPAESANGLKPLRDITTYHTYAYYGLFKPTIAEVLAQIPEDILDQVVAFEIVAMPGSADDLNRDHEAFNAGYHVATTRLYCRE